MQEGDHLNNVIMTSLVTKEQEAKHLDNLSRMLVQFNPDTSQQKVTVEMKPEPGVQLTRYYR